MNLDDPTAVALVAAEALARSEIEHALYGGLLLAAYGTARETRDADMAVAGASAAEASRSVAATGLVRTTIAFERTRFGGLWVSRITLLPAPDGEGLNTLDLVEPRSIDYARRALAAALHSTLRDQPIRLLTPEDFVVFKILSTREQDLVDAGSVLSALGSELDQARIDGEVATLQREIPDHPISERWRRIVDTAR
jgi:hypothetical protein